MKKNVVALLMATVITLSLLGTMFYIPTAQAQVQHDPTWYMTVSGVLDTDTYKLYPFSTNASLKFGFSKFGELIDSRDAYNVGLEYRDRDAFAPPAGPGIPSEILKHKWLSGWLINITYYHIATGKIRNVWAMAQHADLSGHGYDWIRVDDDWLGGVAGGPAKEADEDPRDPGRLISDPNSTVRHGGRKTNGTVTTDPIRVLYNGPRMFIARTVSHVSDWLQEAGTEEPLLDVVFTFIFNKDKKQVIVLKDIKIVTTKFVVGPITVPGTGETASGLIVQFSNRGEWDIGPSPTFTSYVHLYRGAEALPTVYDDEYHLNPTLPPSAYSLYGNQPGTKYDLAQIISGDLRFVGWAAYWPALSDWHVDGGRRDLWWKSLMSWDEHAVDATGGPEPFRSPYLIGEWDFFLTEEKTLVAGRYYDRQFRGVTVYGLTDRWDGDDAGRTGGSNVKDSEVMYQVQEVFNPWDLRQAVHKKTRRWVEYKTVPATAPYTITTAAANVPVKYVSDADWDAYCVFSERIYRRDTGVLLRRPTDYNMCVDPVTGRATFTFAAAHAGKPVKILYSTLPEVKYDKPFTLGPYTANKTISASESTHIFGPYTYSWTDVLGVKHKITLSSDTIYVKNKTLTSDILQDMEIAWFCGELKVPANETKSLVFPYHGRVAYEAEGANINFSGVMWLGWEITAPPTDHVQVTIHSELWANHIVLYDPTAGTHNITVTYNFPVLEVSEKIMGRYEWVIVGNHSRAIDSIGATMVSAAFKNKQVEIGNGGLDMKDVAFGPNVPSMLANMGTASWRANAPAWLNWYDSIGRLHLVDDWCTLYPVTTSNIISVAGPRANLVSEYFNEFTDAIFIYGVPGALLNEVVLAKSCWDTTAASGFLGRTYKGPGLGVITTYKDINGTVGFLIWGWSGDDTYYTCKWFHEKGIYMMQTENSGVTTWILKLTYTDPHAPTVTLVERLGTISEKTPHDP